MPPNFVEVWKKKQNYKTYIGYGNILVHVISFKGHIFLPRFDLFDWSLFSDSNIVEIGWAKGRKQIARA